MDSLEEVVYSRRMYRLRRVYRSGFTVSTRRLFYTVNLTGPIIVACQWYFGPSACTSSNQILDHLPTHHL